MWKFFINLYIKGKQMGDGPGNIEGAGKRILKFTSRK